MTINSSALTSPLLGEDGERKTEKERWREGER